MALDADLYLNRMELEKYCGEDTCELCKVSSFDEFIKKLKSAEKPGGICPHWPEWKVENFRLAVEAGDILPTVPSLDVPRPAKPGLYALMETNDSSPILITGNSELTQAVLLAVLSLTPAPMRLVSVDTLGHTLDMAMVFKELTARKIAQALEEYHEDPVPKGDKPRLILPGLAGALQPELESMLKRQVETGPVCAAELPLYMGEDWVPVS